MKLKHCFVLICSFLAQAWAQTPGTIAFISDLNESYGSTHYNQVVKEAVQELIRVKPDLVLVTGDMVAGQQAGLNYKAMWQSFHQQVSAPLSAAGIPLAITPGNHDASAMNVFKAERAEYIKQWPKDQSKLQFLSSENWPISYSFVAHDTLFISLDATTVGPISAAQKTWLKNQLTKYAHYKRKILFGHLPMWPVVGGSKGLEILGDQALEDLMIQHKVDYYFSGHAHAFYPGKHQGIRFISQACLGAGPRALRGQTQTSARALTYLHLSADKNQDQLELASWDGHSFASDRKPKLPPLLQWQNIQLKLQW